MQKIKVENNTAIQPFVPFEPNISLYTPQSSKGFSVVYFTFRNTSVPVTYDLFNTQQYINSNVTFNISGTMDYNQWNQDSLMMPKILKSIKIITYIIVGGVTVASNTPLQSLNTYYMNVEGQIYSTWKSVKTLISPNQFQQNMSIVEFDADNKEFILNGDSYINNYTFPASSITTMNIEFKESGIEGLLWGDTTKNVVEINSRS